MKSKKIFVIGIQILALTFLLSIASCRQTTPTWPDNILLNPDADEGLVHWQTYDAGVSINETDCDSPCFSLTQGAKLMQDVSIDQTQGSYALVIGCMMPTHVDPNSINDLPYLDGYMMRNQSEIDAYLQGDRMFGESIVENQWTTAWGIFEIPATTIKIRFFLSQVAVAGIPQTGAPAFFDRLGLYQFDTEANALSFVDHYEAGCGTASLVNIIQEDTLTVLSDGSAIVSNRIGKKRIRVRIELGENRRLTGAPVVMYWSDSLDVEGIETSIAVPDGDNGYYIDLPSSEELEICGWMKYIWLVQYENTLISNTGMVASQVRYVMPTSYITGTGSLVTAFCVEPEP